MSGFGLLWDRLNPFGVGKTKAKSLENPSYADVLSALTATTTKQHLEKLNRDHRINLHLRPPGVSAWMANALTAQQMDAAVRKSQAYTNKAITEWKIQATELNANGPKRAVESDLQIAASEVSHVSVPMSPPLSPSRVKKQSSHPGSAVAASTSTPQQSRVNAPPPIQISKQTSIRLGKPSHNRAAHLPSHEVDASPSSPAPASQLVRTFTDQSTTANDVAAVDPAVFLAASSK
jgi:lysophospholipid hydrolase